MISLDTNLLVYAHRSRTPEHLKARKAIESACASRHGCGIALPSISEFWAVVTHPECQGKPSTPKEAQSFITNLVEGAGVRIWSPLPDMEYRLLQAAHDLGIVGPRIFDLQIAIVSADNGAHQVWTHDSGFATIHGLKIFDPIHR